LSLRNLSALDPPACSPYPFYRLHGSALWLRGRRRAALRAWERGAREAERLGMRPELARTLAEVARRTSAEASAAQARAIFEDLGIPAAD
jgi:hypothetical protein